MNTIIIDEKSREIRLKEIIKELDRQCQVVGVGIAGGHTTVCPNVNSPVVSVTAIGHKLRTHQKAVAGQDIVMTKHIGMSGIRTVISHKGMRYLMFCQRTLLIRHLLLMKNSL